MEPPTQATGEAPAGDGEGDPHLAAARLRALMDGIPQLVWRSGSGGRWIWASPRWLAYTGQSEEGSRGLGWLDALHPDDRAAAMAAWGAADAGRPLDMEHRIRRASDGAHRWFATRAVVVRDEAAGAGVEWLGTSTDVQALRASQDDRQALVAELQHRTRNLMGVVRSVMEATLRGDPSPERFAPAFRGRLGALARAQALLSRLGEGERVAFDELVRAELGAELGAVDAWSRGGRVTLDGPAGVPLRSGAVQAVALALHELADAAARGALARPGGRLAVRWRLLDGAGLRLRVEWTEIGLAAAGPGAAPDGADPGAGGFGRELIERALPHQLGAETTYEPGPDGLRCTIALPVSATAR